MLYILLWIQVVGQVLPDELCCWSDAETKCGGGSGNARLGELPPPQDVYVVDSLLSWIPVPGHMNVKYTAQYRSVNSELWQDIPGCARTELTSCDITATKAAAEHGCVELRVRAEKHGQASVPVEACSKKGDFCSPKFTLSPLTDFLTVHLSNNHSLAQTYAGHAEHRVCYGKEGEPPQDFGHASSSVAISDVEEGVRYCVKVQFTIFHKRVGPPSCTQCELIPKSATSHATVVASVVAPSILLVLLVPCIAYILIYKKERIKECMQPHHEMPWFLSEPLPEGHKPISCSGPRELCDRLSLIVCEEEASLSAGPPSGSSHS